MAELIKNFLVSAAKSVLAAIVGALGLFLTQTPPSDQVGLALWGAIVIAVRALISVLERLLAKPLVFPK